MSDSTGASDVRLQSPTSPPTAEYVGTQSTAMPTTLGGAAIDGTRTESEVDSEAAAAAATAPVQTGGASQTQVTAAEQPPATNSRGRISLTLPASTVGGAGGQTRRLDFETLTLDPNDSTKVLARVRKEHPNGVPGQVYEQVDEIPVLDTSVRTPANPKFYFIPNLTASKVPAKNRASKKNNYQPNLWARQGISDTWRRARSDGVSYDVWRPCLVFRRFNLTTNKYEEAYVCLEKIKDADPNDTEFSHGYNKWVDQIKRRRDDTYKKVVFKDHWTVPERRALCSAINDFVREKGLRRFGFGDGVTMSSADLAAITNAVNDAGNNQRKTDAVRGQIHSSHERKNKVIYELMQRATGLRARHSAGERIPHAERYPEIAIPEIKWPVELSKHKKRSASEIIDETDPDLSDTPPVDRDAPARAMKALPTWARNSLSGSGISSKSKKQKFEDAAGNELAAYSSSWDDTDEPVTDATVDESDWDTESEAPTEEQLRQQEALDIQTAIESSFKLEGQRRRTAFELHTAIDETLQPQPVSNGVAVPGEVEGDSGDGGDEHSSRSSRRSLARGGQHGRAHALAVPSSPRQKRERTPEADETEGSDGDDEAEVFSPRHRSIKRMRTARGM